MTEPPEISQRSEMEIHTELFTIRIWREKLNEHFEWRGKIQRIANRDTRYFRSWDMLIDTIREMLPDETKH